MYLYCKVKNANDVVETKRNANKAMIACLTNLEKLRGRGELVRGWKAERTSAWEAWLSMGNRDTAGKRYLRGVIVQVLRREA